MNLRTHSRRIISKAGLTSWPDPFRKLRPSRQTELAGRFPVHRVCAWMGNSRAVAVEPYLHVSDSDIEQALAAESAAQNPAQ